MMEYTFEENQVRTITFTAQSPDGPPTGQQMGMWLPAGEYQLVAKETLRTTYLGQVSEAPSVRLLSKDQSTYYVSIGSIPAHLYAQLPQR